MSDIDSTPFVRSQHYQPALKEAKGDQTNYFCTEKGSGSFIGCCIKYIKNT